MSKQVSVADALYRVLSDLRDTPRRLSVGARACAAQTLTSEFQECGGSALEARPAAELCNAADPKLSMIRIY